MRVSPDGTWEWALRVAWPRIPIGEDDIEAGMMRVRELLPDAQRSEVDWPAEFPALAVPSKTVRFWGRGHPVRVDGEGSLYVFPFIREDGAWNSEDRPYDLLRPVDVYSPEGELLFAGMMPEISWLDATDEHVYGLEFDPVTDEQRAVRYRLVKPF